MRDISFENGPGPTVGLRGSPTRALLIAAVLLSLIPVALVLLFGDALPAEVLVQRKAGPPHDVGAPGPVIALPPLLGALVAAGLLAFVARRPAAWWDFGARTGTSAGFAVAGAGWGMGWAAAIAALLAGPGTHESLIDVAVVGVVGLVAGAVAGFVAAMVLLPPQSAATPAHHPPAGTVPGAAPGTRERPHQS